VRNLGLIVALWLAVLLPTNGFALGLGEIEVNSFLNQPLNAEIEVISARPGEIDDLLVSLASREAFTRAGLARTRNLSELRFSVKKNEEGDQAVILVTTKGSIKEPFLNFLIEADWSKGRVLREFTILLDPPFYADQPASTETASQPVEQPVTEEASVSEIVEQAGVTPIAESSEPAETSETISEPIALAEDTEPEPAQPEPASDAYVAAETQNIIEGDVSVVKGDTLWSIASGYKDQDHSMAQVMLAFQRANPGAFNDGNINNMKVGAVLRAPSADELNAIGQQEAYAEVLVQNGLWDEYVERVTGVSPAVASEDGGAEVAIQEDSTEAEGELSLLLPGEGETESTGIGDTGDVDALRTRLAIAEEELDASRIENQELESRIAELQARLSKVEELQKMVEIEDDSLAQMQADQAETAELMEQVEEQAATESVSDAIEADVEADEEALLEELLAEEAAAQAEEQAVSDGTAVEAAASDDALVDDDTLTDDTMAEEAVTETASTDGMMTEEADTEPTVPAPVIVTEPVARAPSIFDGILPPDIIDMIPSMPAMAGILNDPIILGAVGGVIILLLILIVLKRRKSSSDDESGISASSDEDLFAAEEDEELTPIHLADGGVHVAEPDETDIKIPTEEDVAPAESDAEPQDDLAATAIISAVDMPEPEAPAPAAATAEQDDVLNEVDVYLAYGLYDNAEDLLNSSLTENPDRADYRSKLLDTYFATKNIDAFSKEADKLKSMGDAASGYWDRVQIMGYELAPDNPLFSDARDSGLSAADLEITKPQEADFDLGASEDDDTNFSTTDFNLGEEDTGSDFSDTSNFGEAGEIAATQQIPQLDDLPELDDEDDTSLRAEAEAAAAVEAEADTALDLPDEVGDELEFSMDDDTSSSDSEDQELLDSLELGSTDGGEGVATDDVDMEDIAMEFDIAEDEAVAVDEKSEVDFGAEFEEALEEADGLELDDSEVIPFEPDLTDSTSAAMEIDDDAVELNRTSDDETGFTDTAIVSPGFDDENDDSIDLGMEDTAMIDLDSDETSLGTSELNLDTAELNLDTAESVLAAADDEDISIIDFGGEDFVEPTDVIESIEDPDDSVAIDIDVDDGDEVKTGTFAPGDFEEPTAAVDPISDIDDIGDLMLPDDVDEVSTKLDLARAFIDMGDTEGARGSLEEVMSEGNDEQKTEAKSLLEQI
jgi:pilus assembly protein FimV